MIDHVQEAWKEDDHVREEAYLMIATEDIAETDQNPEPDLDRDQEEDRVKGLYLVLEKGGCHKTPTHK